jgi:SAM-dependent methyltransferase
MKLHLGCGKRYIPGFTHVDLADFPHIDYNHNIRTLPMFEDDSTNLIYACHCLEYFDRIEAVEVLKEWRRVLKPGGIVRLSVPDLWALMEVYKRTQDESLIMGPLFGRWVIKEPGGIEHTIYHCTAYDVFALGDVLKLAGFRNDRRWDWRTTEHSEYDDYSQAYLPHLDREHGKLISLNMEATK